MGVLSNLLGRLPLSLHGHIHESRGRARIGSTVAINPGSVYSEGTLQGAVIDLKPEVEVRGLVQGCGALDPCSGMLRRGATAYRSPEAELSNDGA